MQRKTLATLAQCGPWKSQNGAARVLLERICPSLSVLRMNLSSSQKSEASGKRAHSEIKNEFPHKIGFIGSGNMAKAIAFSILDSGISSPKHIVASGTTLQHFATWKERGVATTFDNAEVVDFADIVFIAAPPQHFTDVVSSLQKSKLSVDYQKCFVSTMGGKTIKSLEE
uniref:Pyrroline-5-carboxylate reductase 3 n=1 Tax=Lygus hesperus TaxID=30085 RepID=A0A146LWJ6_LYGHE